MGVKVYEDKKRKKINRREYKKKHEYDKTGLEEETDKRNRKKRGRLRIR